MIVITGPMSSVRSPSASRRLRPRSTASAAATACATLNETVALIDTPRYVASSMTAMPTFVAGNLTMMFGATSVKWTPWPSIGSKLRQNVGLVCIDSRPCRPPYFSNAGMQQRRALARHLLDDRPREMRLGRAGHLRGQLAHPPPPAVGILLPDVVNDRRVGRGAHRAVRDRIFQLVDGARVVPDVSGRRGRLLERAQRARLRRPPSRAHQVVAELGGALEDVDRAGRAVDADAVAVVDARRRVLGADHGRDAELATAAPPDVRSGRRRS